MEMLEARVTALMGGDDRSYRVDRIALLMDVLATKRRGLRNLVTPVRDVRGAMRVKAIFDRIARIDCLLALLGACYEEEARAVGQPLERRRNAG